MRPPILGWDVGGANLKAARIDGDGDIRVLERPFALWREPQRLSAKLAAMAGDLGSVQAMAVTMTAELADCFATKRDGVAFVLDAFRAAFPETDAVVYGVDGRFRSIELARQEPLKVAAANWMATATLVARTFPDALFIDVGSTTTDIVPIAGGRVIARGRTDPARLMRGELVYTGALRTPACAIARTVPFRGRRCRVAAEHFAIAADIHVWLEQIAPDDYTCDTPDGRGRSRDEAAARIARIVCADLEMIDAIDVTAMAAHLARRQVRQIAAGVRQVLKRLGARAPRLAVLAGRGAFMARAAAEDVGLDARELPVEICPASAVAWLLAEKGGSRTLRGPYGPQTGFEDQRHHRAPSFSGIRGRAV